jgi:hypothetical protein
MYIIEALKQEFPEVIKDIEEYDAFLNRYYEKEDLVKIFDSEKQSYELARQAWAALRDKKFKDYNKYQCWYSRAMNSDPDFLRHFIKTMFNDTTDYSDKTVEELQQIIKQLFIKEGVR